MNIPANHSAESFEKLLTDLPIVDVDQKITIEFLQEYSFNKGREAAELIRLLTFLKFVIDGFSSSYWQEYAKVKDNKPILRRAIKEGYAPLFHDHPNAHRESKATRLNWIQAMYGYKLSTAERAERTFRRLCEFAEFSDKDANTTKTTTGIVPERPLGSQFEVTIKLSLEALGDQAFLTLLKKYAH